MFLQYKYLFGSKHYEYYRHIGLYEHFKQSIFLVKMDLDIFFVQNGAGCGDSLSVQQFSTRPPPRIGLPPAKTNMRSIADIFANAVPEVFACRAVSCPPLESLRFFEAAARHQSFARGRGPNSASTAPAVADRIRKLENHLDAELFDRRQRSVRLNRRGQAYLKEVQRILADVHGVSQLHRRQPSRVRIVSVEAVAEKWLLPRLASFKADHPNIAIELETNHRGVDPTQRDFDAWLAYTGETAAPRPLPRREDTLLEETLYEEDLLPVCSPTLLAARGRPRSPADLHGWPPALRSRLGHRLVVLVRAPRPVRAGPVASLGLPPLQHAGSTPP